MKIESYKLEETMEYLLGKEDGMNLALMIVGRRHINSMASKRKR